MGKEQAEQTKNGNHLTETQISVTSRDLHIALFTGTPKALILTDEEGRRYKIPNETLKELNGLGNERTRAKIMSHMLEACRDSKEPAAISQEKPSISMRDVYRRLI
jgi:hypothetical protein